MYRTLTLLACVAWCAGCASTARITPPASQPASANRYIKHIVIIIEENRSFDDMFSGFPGADAPSYGYAGKKRVELQPVALENRGNIENNWSDALSGWDMGKMDGFGRERLYGRPRTFPYAYVPRDESAPYWTMARQYVLADRMFPTEFGPSFTAHLSLIAGNTDISPKPLAEVDAPYAYPWGCTAPPGSKTFTLDVHRVERFDGPFPCFDNFPTIADRLDPAGISWKYYAAPLSNIGGQVWSEFSAVRAVRYGPDWKNVITPQTRVLRDVDPARLPTSLGSRRTGRTPITRAAVTIGDRHGLARLLMPSVRARIGRTPRSSSSGTIGAGGTTACLRRNSTFVDSAFACRASSSRPTRARAMFRTRSTSTAAS